MIRNNYKENFKQKHNHNRHHPSHIMDGEVIRSNESLELAERRYTLIKCLILRFKAYGIELSAGFYKEHFKDLLTLPSGTPIATLQGHTNYMRCLIAHNNILYSGSGDDAIRAWSLDANECVAALQGHAGAVSRLIVHNSILYSGSYDKTIRAWTVKKYSDAIGVVFEKLRVEMLVDYIHKCASSHKLQVKFYYIIIIIIIILVVWHVCMYV